MSLSEKEVKCACGAILKLTLEKEWCNRCGSPVFYDPKKNRTHKINELYVYAAIGFAIFMVFYLSMEYILPLLRKL